MVVNNITTENESIVKDDSCDDRTMTKCKHLCDNRTMGVL